MARIQGRVSVVVTNYNKGQFLTDCLNSVADQTYDDWELILIDDASTDDSEALAIAWLDDQYPKWREDDRYLFCRLPRNIGYAGAVSFGMFLARGEFIAAHDSDDKSMPERLSRQVDYMNAHPEIELLGTNYKVINDKGEDLPLQVTWLYYGSKIGAMYAAGGHCVCHGTVLLRGSLFDRIGGQTRRVEGAEDYEFIAKCLNAERNNIENLPEILYAYRKSNDQRSRQYFGAGRTDFNGEA